MTTPKSQPSRDDSRRDRGRDRRRHGGKDHHISVRAVRRDSPDLRKLGRAVLEIAVAQAEADAQAQAESGGLKDIDGDDVTGQESSHE